MKNTFSILACTLTLAALIVGCNKVSEKSFGIDISLLDTTVRPQDNFYNYVNGTWMAKNHPKGSPGTTNCNC